MTRKMGRLAPHPVDTHPRLRLGDFLTGALPSVPATVDYISAVPAWPMSLNDEIGDCTIAAAGHMATAWRRYGQGISWTLKDADALKAYEAVSGYVPGDESTDQGAVMQDVLSYWSKSGIGGDKVTVFAQVDHSSDTEIKAALYTLGHVYLGVNLPNSALDQFDAGQPWDVVPHDGGIAGGHAINLGYAGPDGYKVISWGRVVDVSRAWLERYCEEAWTTISLDWMSTTGRSPEGLDLAAIGGAYSQITGKPNPFPVQPPTPTPVPPVPAPGPVPVADPDIALVDALDPWAEKHHTGINAAAARAFVQWRHAKNL